jgi:MinD-like ATPase involved in chromosome partitioning or flagellar assembly
MWSVKGGAGVTVTAAATAGGWAMREGRTLLVDLAGDLPAVFGMAEPAGPGALDWLAAPDSTSTALERLCVGVCEGLELVPVGSGAARPAPGRARALAVALSGLGRRVVVDAGRCGGPGAEHWRGELVAALCEQGSSLLVTRPCYLSLRRAVSVDVRADGVVLVTEPGRSLGRREVASVIGAPVMAEVELDPSVGRSVDSGLLLRRRHRAFERSMRELWR